MKGVSEEIQKKFHLVLEEKLSDVESELFECSRLAWS